jgi:hypothetical protein
MKKVIYLIFTAIIGLCTSCENELDIPAQSAIAASSVPLNAEFIETQVVSVYAITDGNLDNGNVWRSAASNWVYGEVASDNAYKGSDPGDQQDIAAFERYQGFPSSSFVDVKWRAVYEGISRANLAINAVNNGVAAGTLTEAQAKSFLGELRFLRAHFHFEAKKMWGNVPFIDETITESTTNLGVDVWSRVEEDFAFAVSNLSETATRVGGATSWSAKAYLAKAHMYQLDFPSAKPILDDVINNGPYALNVLFHDNFNADTENSLESVFAVQYSVNDASNDSSNGNWGDILNFPNTSPIGGGCCGFFQPSQNLVNAYKTDANGLPLLDTFNNEDVKNDQGISSDEPFTPYTGTLDPRLDWTVGRRGIPFLGWGDFPGRAWIRDQSNGGPYVQMKTVYSKDQEGSAGAIGTWGGVNSINLNIIRFAEVLLWRAEIAAEEGDLETAKTLVNRVRERAANPLNFVRRNDGTPAANYVVGVYSSFTDKEMAIKAVDFEERIELALEGHRFFELVRKDKASQVLNAYLEVESTKRSHLMGASFQPTAEVYPIPQDIINLSRGVLEQNPGY